MTFNPQQFLDEHGGDALAALMALAADRDAHRNGRDNEGQSALRARRERDEARARAQQLEEEAAQLRTRVAPDGAVTLTGEDATVWQQLQERGGLSAWDADRAQAQVGQQAQQRALRLSLATSHQYDPVKLDKLLAGRTLIEREEQQDGQPVRVIGFQQGETFTPAESELADFADSLRVTPNQGGVRVITQAGARGGGKSENPVLAQQRARYHRPGQKE